MHAGHPKRALRSAIRRRTWRNVREARERCRNQLTGQGLCESAPSRARLALATFISELATRRRMTGGGERKMRVETRKSATRTALLRPLVRQNRRNIREQSLILHVARPPLVHQRAHLLGQWCPLGRWPATIGPAAADVW